MAWRSPAIGWRAVPVEFLSDQEAAAYGRFDGVPSRAKLERAFFLDDADKALIAKRRGIIRGWALRCSSPRCGSSGRSFPIRWTSRPRS